MQVMQVMQIMHVMQVMQAVKLFSESISHWAFFQIWPITIVTGASTPHNDCCLYAFKDLHLNYNAGFHHVAFKTKSVKKGSDSNSVCYIKPNHFTHVLFPQYSSLSQAMSNQTKCSTLSSLQIKWFNKYVLCGNTKPNNSAHVLFFTL